MAAANKVFEKEIQRPLAKALKAMYYVKRRRLLRKRVFIWIQFERNCLGSDSMNNRRYAGLGKSALLVI